MREFIFRGKRLGDGKWIQGKNIHYLYNEDDESRCVIHPSGEYLTHVGDGFVKYRPFVVDLNTVGQFIGRLDEDGVKVFEGDIVLAGFDGDKMQRAIIDYSDKECRFYISFDSDAEQTKYFISPDIKLKVVGNIHD